MPARGDFWPACARRRSLPRLHAVHLGECLDALAAGAERAHSASLPRRLLAQCGERFVQQRAAGSCWPKRSRVAVAAQARSLRWPPPAAARHAARRRSPAACCSCGGTAPGWRGAHARARPARPAGRPGRGAAGRRPRPPGSGGAGVQPERDLQLLGWQPVGMRGTSSSNTPSFSGRNRAPNRCGIAARTACAAPDAPACRAAVLRLLCFGGGLRRQRVRWRLVVSVRCRSW